MRITDLATIDPQYKEIRKAVTLAETLTRRLAYHEKHTELLSDDHRTRANELIRTLETYTNCRLDRDELKSNTPWGGSLLQAPTREILAWTFNGLREPGPAQHDYLTQTIVEQMNQAGRDKRAAEHSKALAYEIAYRSQQGWFIIFNTLTVAPGNYYQVFSATSAAFRDYIRDVDRKLAAAAHGSYRNAQKQNDYHTYFAVVEEGAKNGRLHIHVVHLFSHLPAGSEDPNKALAIPTRRELNTFKANWKYGFTSPIMVRFAPNDAYGQAGYRWPYDLKTNAPLLIRSNQALAGYMAKYITKSYSSNKRSDTLWRVRKSQKLGRKLLAELLSTLTPQHLLAIASHPELNVRLNNQKIPPAMLRQAALRKFRQSLSIDEHRSFLTKAVTNLQPLPSLLHSSRGLTRDSIIHSLRNTTHTLAMFINEEDTSDAWYALKQRARLINRNYFRETIRRYGTTSTRDHLYAAYASAAKTL